VTTAPDPRMPDMPADADRSRGRYVHLLEGAPAGVDQRYVLGDVGGGAIRIRSTRVTSTPVARSEFDIRLTPAGVSVVLRWVGSGSGAGVVRAATIECAEVDDGLEIRREIEGRHLDPVHLPGSLILPSLVLGGLMPAGEGRIFHPGDGAEPDDFLPRPVSMTREDLGDEVVMVGGSDVVGTAVAWRMSGALDLEGVDVIEGGLLLRRTTGAVVATLTEVSGPWPRPSEWPSAVRPR